MKYFDPFTLKVGLHPTGFANDAWKVEKLINV